MSQEITVPYEEGKNTHIFDITNLQIMKPHLRISVKKINDLLN